MGNAKLSEKTKERLTSLARLIVLVPMVFLGNEIRLYVHNVWAEHSLSKDGKTAQAIIIKANPKRVFDYRYSVEGKQYVGTCKRDWEDEKVHELKPGEEVTVFFSASHPWLSSFRRSQVAWAALPFVVLMLLFELFFLAVLVDPCGRWSLSRWLLKN